MTEQITPAREPRFRRVRADGWSEWQVRLGPWGAWGGFHRNFDLGLSFAIQEWRAYAHVSLGWIWLSTDFVYPRDQRTDWAVFFVTLITPEEWRVVPSRPDYAVSSLGRIRREVSRSPQAVAGRVLTPCIAGRWKAYLGVRLWDWKTQTGKTVNVQNLVAEAFLGPRPTGLEINHKNGVTTDNSAANLEYVTKRQNEDHAIAHGLHPKGERHHSAKLTEAQVREILAVPYRERGTMKKLAERFGVRVGALTQVRMGKTWRHIKTTEEEKGER